MTRTPSNRLLVVAINFAPELTGIGKYVGEMTDWLSGEGFEVRVVTAPPYYPAWSVQPGYGTLWYSRERLAGAEVYRCPLWVPRKPNGLTRMLHLRSFALTSLPVTLWQAIFWRPKVVFVVEPALSCVPGAWVAAKLCGARRWLHVQDFEVDAAFDLGLLRAGWFRRAVLGVERWLMRGFDRVSSISERMLAKLEEKGVAAERIGFFPNWVDTAAIRPLESEGRLRAELGIEHGKRVLLYSGSMGEKQGLEIVINAARAFASVKQVLFVLCGDGGARRRLEAAAAGLDNVRFIPLQPADRLNELLNLADVHLLPQRADAEDLVMPSKLTAIMASGRPVVATARAGSDLARIAAEGGIVVAPGDWAEFEWAIRSLLADDRLRRALGASARAYALLHWDREVVLRRAFEVPGWV
jgi:colanic acid biosynthesis glycosyl transferase WcaI